jgi:hypothetical protein
MSYSQGGLIAASDYNSFVGTSPSSTANQINTIWAVGNGQYGYGQSALSQVSATGLVTATQWATAVNTLNSIKTHQTGTGTGIAAPTAGNLIAYLSTFSSNINTAYSSALSFNSQGSTTTGSVFAPAETYTNLQAAVTFTITRTATFASADQARYFFNAGGQLNFVITGVTNNDGTSRSGDMVTLTATNLSGYSAFRATSGGGRTGTGGTLNTNATNIGYYSLTTSPQTLTQITSTTSGYTSDYVILAVQSNGAQGSNADKGTVITFTLTMFSAARPTLPAPPPGPGPGGIAPTTNTVVNDTINVTVSHRVDVVYPETSNLSNSWGTVTIA